MKAAATLFKIPIYCCVQHGTSFQWNVVASISLDIAKLPNIMDEVAQEKMNISRIEVYHSADHYDAITSLHFKFATWQYLIVTRHDYNY